LTTASVQSLDELESFFLVLDSSYSSISLSDTSPTAEAFKHLQQYRPLSDGQMSVTRNTNCPQSQTTTIMNYKQNLAAL